MKIHRQTTTENRITLNEQDLIALLNRNRTEHDPVIPPGATVLAERRPTNFGDLNFIIAWNEIEEVA